MRFVNIILAFLVLFLSLVPCSDGGVSNKNYQYRMTDSHSHQTPSDNCTPFCSCVCCSSNITLEDVIFEILTPEIYSHQEVCFHSSSDVLEFTYPVWQPPKI